MDLSFPLRYENGSLQLTEDSYSQAYHLVRTTTGERPLYTTFGVPIELLYSTKIPELLEERVRLQFAQLGIPASVKIGKISGGSVELIIKT